MSRRWDDSGGDYLQTTSSPYNISTNGAYSMALYVNMDNTNDEMTALAKYSGTIGPIIRVVNKKVRFFTIRNSGGAGVEAIGGTDIAPGAWQLIGGSWDGSNVMRVILNGVQDGATTLDAQRAGTEAAQWRVGQRNDNVFPWNGMIYYAAIWSSYLTDYNWRDLGLGVCPSSIAPGSLAAWWVLQGASPEVDQTGGGDNLALTGTAPFESSSPVNDCFGGGGDFLRVPVARRGTGGGIYR